MESILRFYYMLLLTVISLVFASQLSAGDFNDSDNDSIPDALEKRLGTNPQLDEGLVLIYDDKAQGKGDKDISSNRKLAPDIVKVYMCNVAGNRYLWKIEFNEDYLSEGSIFHLYTDIDYNKETGRQDKEFARGVDIMYSFVDGHSDPRIITPSVRSHAKLPIRGIVEGNAIYVCDDVDINTKDGKTLYRAYLLSHRKNPTSDNDHTTWFDVSIPLHPNRKKPKLPYPEMENFERLPAWHELIYNLWQDESNIRLYPKDANVKGFIIHTNDDLEGRGKATERADFSSPAEGKYYLSLVLLDEPSRLEGLDFFVNDKKVGTVAGFYQNRAQILYTTTMPIKIKKGDIISITNSKYGTASRFRNFMLLKERPRVPKLRIENLSYYMLPNEPGKRLGRVMLAWTTNRPTECKVHYRVAGPEAIQQSGTLEEGRGVVNNHKLLLPSNLNASRYRFVVTASEPTSDLYEAQTATSDPIFVDMLSRIKERVALRPGIITLSVMERTKSSRRSWPVSSGVPFPDKTLADASTCRILDPDGKVIPAQFEVMSYWPSGHIKWLLVDFLANTNTKQPTKYTLEYNLAAKKVPNLIAIYEKGDALTVTTGPLKIMLRKNAFVPFENVWIDENHDGKFTSNEKISDPSSAKGFVLVNGNGETYSTALSSTEEFVLEKTGPIRATIRVRGKFVATSGKSYMRYLCRLHFYAGKPWVKVVFSLDNDVLFPRMNLVTSLRAEIPTPINDEAKIWFGGNTEETKLKANAEIRLLQDYDNRFLINIVDHKIEGKRAAGFAAITGSKRRFMAVVRNFWQTYPKAFTVAHDGLRVELLPALPSNQYQSKEDQKLLTRLYFWCDKGRYKLAAGVRITTEFLVDFSPSNTADNIEREVTHFQNPIFAAATTQWYCDSGAFGPVYPRKEGIFDVYEKGLDKAFKNFLRRRESVREYGFMNYGDWFGERTWNWGNIEYDTQWGLALNFIRTGNLDMLWRADEAEWHNGDVDTTHYDARESNVGRVYAHCTGHTGGYFPRSWKGMGGFNIGPRGSGHTWAQGHFALYALTGKRRYLENGNLVANQIATYLTTNFDFNSERSVGWPIIACMGGYEFTANPFYLNAAKLMADVAVWKQHPDRGLWGHYIGECRRYKHFPPHWGAKPFMTGILLHGLKLYDLAQPREDVKRAIRTNCDFLWRETYIAKDNGFIYAQCAQYWNHGSTWTISLVGDGLAYGCLIDPEHKHLDLLKRAVAGNMYKSKVGSFGKSLSQGICFYPNLIHDLVELGVTQLPQPELLEAR